MLAFQKFFQLVPFLKFNGLMIVIEFRFGGGVVVVHAPSKGRGRELQLPSIQQLTSKSSSQHFLLRILKVIIQLRQATKTAVKKSHTSGESAYKLCMVFQFFLFGLVSRHVNYVFGKWV
jgi:hypothetical protein